MSITIIILNDKKNEIYKYSICTVYKADKTNNNRTTNNRNYICIVDLINRIIQQNTYF